MAGIRIDAVRKAFFGHEALASVSLNVADGEFVALLGPSGCGKTTLLRIIAGLETQTSGRVLIGDRDVSDLPPRKRGLAMGVPKLCGIPAHDGARQCGVRAANGGRRSAPGSTGRSHGRPHSSTSNPTWRAIPASFRAGSANAWQVARALAVEPSVLLMDEPLSNLDALLRCLRCARSSKPCFARRARRLFMSPHDQTEAMGLADRVAVLHAGHIVQTGAPTDIYRYPATRFVGWLCRQPAHELHRATGHGGARATRGRGVRCCPRTQKRSCSVCGGKTSPSRPAASPSPYVSLNRWAAIPC